MKQISIDNFNKNYKSKARGTTKAKRLEDECQMAFVQLMTANKSTKHVFFHSIPNEGKRTAWQGKRLKDMGLTAGTPDVLIPVRTKHFGGMYIEFKAKGKGLRKTQREAARRLAEQGFYVVVHDCPIEAWKDVRNYLKEEVANQLDQ